MAWERWQRRERQRKRPQLIIIVFGACDLLKCWWLVGLRLTER
jgi:hypothetical protein